MRIQTRVFKWTQTFLLSALLSMLSVSAFAWSQLIESPLTNGYGACSWQENGDGTSTLRVSINFKEAAGHIGNEWRFYSRGVLLYTYDKNGTMNQSSSPAKTVRMNGIPYKTLWLGGWGYQMYTGGTNSCVNCGGQYPEVAREWKRSEAFVADVEVVIDNSVLSDWPALSIRAGNSTSGADVADSSGAAYLGRFGTSSNCALVDPVVPPPPPIGIRMTAPDWNLGELPDGDSEKVLSTNADQLCFAYLGSAVSGKKFVINASNLNGIVGNRYRMKNDKDSSQLIPYDVTLDSGSSTLHLPNANNAALSLDSSGRTCFFPTFRTTVDRGLKDGDYNDVLFFTVVTKS
ncbi:hypothetical protein [Burkholderia sp. IMCC1007]|uniref:hypothetical protein n=1 Tax=Burkholderia sp. IMCC1007 TaxID=3004104 RepID=UPI0022B2DCD8|nr:hypothetical protein [Burkholderia sp. IMCC1007]